MNGLSRLGKKKKWKFDFVVLSRPKTTSKKQAKKKSSLFLGSIFFCPGFPNFFFCGDLVNRFRLAELGGVEPLKKLLRRKLVPGPEFQISQKSRNCSRKPGICTPLK